MFAASKTDSASTSGYQISRSLRFNSADSAYLNRTPASATNQKTWTWSGWVKRSTLRAGLTDPATIFNAGGNGFLARFSYANQDQLEFYNYSGAAYQLEVITTQVFRDVSAWYHIVFVLDTTQATSSNRFKVYVNGSQITAFSTATYPSQNADLLVNNTSVHAIGVLNGIGGYYNGYITDVNFIDGQALTPSSFGETNAQTGVWQPKAYSGSYGTNGFYLNFSDNSNTTAATLGKDYSGNGNNWTPNGFLVSAGPNNDSLVDVPTSYGVDTGVGGTVRGNYATLNPLNTTGGTISNGNLDYAMGNTRVASNFAMSSGSWYFEVKVASVGSTVGLYTIGLAGASTYQPNGFASGFSAVMYYAIDGSKYVDGTGSSYGSSYGSGDVIGVAVNATAGTVTFYKNNTSQGSITLPASSSGWVLSLQSASSLTDAVFNCNFGQRPFAYTAPSGFKALCTQNLPTPTIGATTATQAGKFFNTVVYNGANQTPQNITTVGFQPDFTWIKWRANTYYHNLFDVIRGVNNVLSTNVAVAEGIRPGTLTSFNSDGFSLGNDSTYSGVNIDATSYVAWNWKANGAGVTNTSGSITSTVSANTTSGFSVVTYTGNGTIVAANGTVGHGLGVVPSMIIIKRRDSTGFWYVATKDGGTATSPTYSLFTRGSSGLNQTGAAFTTGQSYASSGYITSSTFNLYWLNAAVTAGDSYDINYNTGTYVAYCFAEVAGYSKFGSYTGNGSSDGPFVYTGFRPAFLMIKRTDATSNAWMIYDGTRNTSNITDKKLAANLSVVENEGAQLGGDSLGVDFLSNGFKSVNQTGTNQNASGGSYIYAAFAEHPFKYSLAR